MILPYLNELPSTREFTDVFGGYNHNLRIGDGEFYDMKNLTSSDYPVLSPRPPRGVYAEPESATGLISKDGLCYCDGADFCIGEQRIDMGLNDSPKRLVSMGAYVIIMPDKKYINTADLSDRGDIETSVTTQGTVTLSLCDGDGELYERIYMSDTAPDPRTARGIYWLDTSSDPIVMKEFSWTDYTWHMMDQVFVKISYTDIGTLFEVGDTVTLSGVNMGDNEALNGSFVISAKEDDSLLIPTAMKGLPQSDAITEFVYYDGGISASQEAPLTVANLMPMMDFIIESENRLWGCRYGEARNGETVNEIYACKLGDFRNWNSFAGVSTDSYAATVGTDGPFTGAVTYLGHPIFFKENHMHKIFGNFPSNYQIQTTNCRGVQRGSDLSLCIVNEVLYYKSRSSVCAYDGSLPTEISAPLGDIRYSEAVGGPLGNKYYISMSDTDGVPHLFVYDTSRGLWHREDNTRARAFCADGGELYFIDSDGKIKTVKGSGTPDRSRVSWSAQTGILGMSSPDKKYISRIDVRLAVSIGTRVCFYIEYDSSGEWHHLYTMTGTRTQSFAVPLIPRRCDHFRLRIDGEGEAKIFSICKTTEGGSDL